MSSLEAIAASPVKRLKTMLRSGNLWLYLLSLIARAGRLHAYDLDSRIEKEYLFRPNKILVYVVLYKLEAEGLISSENEQRRKYYKLTDKGRESLSLAKDYFKVLSAKL